MELSFMSFSLMKDALKGKMDAEKLCAIASENGIYQLDLLDYEVKLYKPDRLKMSMKKSGVRCGCIITTPSFFSAPDKVEAEIKKAISITKDLRAELLMVVPGVTGVDKKACRRMSLVEMKQRAVDMFSLAVKLGKECDIKVGFENTPAYYKPLSSAQHCRDILDRVPELGLIFDTGNFRIADTNCDELKAYELLKDRIIRVHVKDVVIGDFKKGERCVDGKMIQTVTSGSGVIPVQEILRHLKADGYDATLAVEYSAKPRVNGIEHSKWLQPYARYIREAWENVIKYPPYSKIEGLDKPVSRLFFGTAVTPMSMGQNAEALLDAVYALGINAFDCARGYGLAEKSLGNWVKSRNNRERIIILSKCGNVSLSGKVCINKKVIEKELTKSLKTLGTEYIDIYLLHRDDPQTSVGEIIECLNEAKRAGKIKVFGVSNWSYERIREANLYAEEHGLEGFSVSSPNYGLARQIKDPWGGGCVSISGPENTNAREWYANNQMPVIAYSSLGRGFFSGRFKSGDYETAKTVLDPFAQKGYLYEENMQRLSRAEELAERYNCSVANIAMRYIFSGKMNVFAIVSSTNPERLVGNVEATLSKLSEEDFLYLENDDK